MVKIMVKIYGYYIGISNLEMIDSYGLLLIDNSSNLLGLRRRYSLAFSDFIRTKGVIRTQGPHSPFNPQSKYDYDYGYINHLISLMTTSEIHIIKQFLINPNQITWRDIWRDYWITNIKPYYRDNAYKKLVSLNYNKLIFNSSHTSTEWGFPKGRGVSELPLETAKREFFEETNIKTSNLHITDKTFVEEFVGTNGINYRHTYWLCYLRRDIDFIIEYENSIGKLPITTLSQQLEVDRVEFIPFHLWKILIRPYETYRLNLIVELEDYIKHNLIIS